MRLLLHVLKELGEAAALFEGHAIGELCPCNAQRKHNGTTGSDGRRVGFPVPPRMYGTDLMWEFESKDSNLFNFFGTATTVR